MCVINNVFCVAVLGTKSKCVRYRLCIRDKKGKSVTLQTRDDQEKCEWLTHLRQLNRTDDKQEHTEGPVN